MSQATDPTAELLEVIVTAQRALGAARRRLEGLPAPTDEMLPGLETVDRTVELQSADQNAGGESKHPHRRARPVSSSRHP